MTDEEYMQLAITEAEKVLSEGGLPVGAVLVHDKEVIAVAKKDVNDFHLGHAEMCVLQKVFKNKRIPRGKHFTLYTTIEPCIMCYGAILHCPIKKVIYGLEDPWGGATLLNNNKLPMRHKKLPEIVGGVMREEVKIFTQEFLKQTDDPYWHMEDNIFVKRILE